MYPVLFTIPLPWGDQRFHAYGIMLALSLLLAWYAVRWLGVKKEGLSPDVMWSTFFITGVSAVVCSRVLHVLTNVDRYDSLGDLFDVTGGGLVAYGGFLGGLAGSWAFLRHKKVSLLAWADVTAPTLALGLGLVRIGCYLNGCDYGKQLSADAPGWLQSLGTFPRWSEGVGRAGSPAFLRHVRDYDLSPLADACRPVHPTQLYESLVGFVLVGVSVFVWRRRRFRGQVILILAMLYGCWRTFVEVVRDDPMRGYYFGLSTSQLISMALVPACGYLYLRLRKRPLASATPEDSVAPTVEDEPAKEPTEPKKRKKRKKRR